MLVDCSPLFRKVQNQNQFYFISCLGDKAAVEFLLNKGANVDIQNTVGFTPLSIAAQNGNSIEFL